MDSGCPSDLGKVGVMKSELGCKREKEVGKFGGYAAGCLRYDAGWPVPPRHLGGYVEGQANVTKSGFDCEKPFVMLPDLFC